MPLFYRSWSNDLRLLVIDEFASHVKDSCWKRGLFCSIDHKHDQAAIACDPDMITDLIAACQASQQVCDLQCYHQQVDYILLLGTML